MENLKFNNMKTKHTKGGWYTGVLDMTDGIPTINIMSDKGMSHPRIAKSLSGNVEENKANAELMASAPELLNACYYARHHLSGGGTTSEEVLDKLNEIIKRATE